MDHRLYLSEVDDEELFHELANRLQRRLENETGESNLNGNFVFSFSGCELDSIEEQESGITLFHY
jgi:hypothetical protein